MLPQVIDCSRVVALRHDRGVRRSELLGLRWTDLDIKRSRLSVNRGLVAVGYALHKSRGKTENSRRCIDLDPTTSEILQAWHALQSAEATAIGNDHPGWMFATPDGQPVHPHALSQAFERIARRAGFKVIRLHDLRHAHATLLIAAGVPIKVVSERLGRASPAFTIETYKHVLPGMQAAAARTIETLVTAVLPATPQARKAG